MGLKTLGLEGEYFLWGGGHRPSACHVQLCREQCYLYSTGNKVSHNDSITSKITDGQVKFPVVITFIKMS